MAKYPINCGGFIVYPGDKIYDDNQTYLGHIVDKVGENLIVSCKKESICIIENILPFKDGYIINEGVKH